MWKKRLSIVALGLVLSAGLAAAAAPKPASFSGRHISGRQVWLQWARATSDTQVYYDIYRDEELLTTVVDGQTRPDPDEFTWRPSPSGSLQYFYDNTTIPGATYTYSVRTRIGGDVSQPATITVSVAKPGISNLSASFRNGREVGISWHRIFGDYFNVTYEVYQDDQKIATIIDGEKSTGETGDTWSSGPTWLHYYGSQGYPGKQHEYRVVAILFDDFSVERRVTLNVPVAVPTIANYTLTYRTGRRVDVSWNRVKGNFFEVEYAVFRDGEKIAEFADGTGGTGANGDSWSAGGTGVWQTYTDSGAVPGQTHTYTVVATLFDDCTVSRSSTVDVGKPGVSNLSASHATGRQVNISWKRVSGEFFDVHYEVYRDGERIAFFQDGTNGGNGEAVWSIDSIGYWQYFRDQTAWPGSTHVYRVVAILYGRCQSEKSTTITLTKPGIANLGARHGTGRKVTVDWKRITGNFLDVRYTIFRDGEKLASFEDGTAGKGEAGDSWTWGGSGNWQTYYDATAIPGKTHEYRVVARLFDGCETERTVFLEIADVAFPSISFMASSAERRAKWRWKDPTAPFFDITYEVVRDGVKIAEFPAGDGSTPEFTWDISLGYQYFYDLKTHPGATHQYEFRMSYFPGCERARTLEFTAPRSTLTGMTISYSGVRSVQISWTRKNENLFDIEYTVYRDGERLASFASGSTGSVEDGHAWRISGTTQYFIDAGAVPGKTHVYRVVAKLDEDCLLPLEKSFAVPSTILPVPTCTYQSGRTVRLSWKKIAEHPTFAVEYAVYRDGLKLASFPADEAATGETGDSWQSDASTQYYYDVAATPYSTHTYRVEATLFPDCTVYQERDYAVPGPLVTAPTFTINSFRQVTVTIGAVSDNAFPEATLEVYRNGGRIGALSPVNGKFPSTFVDDSIAVADGPHFYQFMITLYPGCVSGLSSPFDLIVSPPPQPGVLIADRTVGSVTVACTGGSSPTPQYYRIYRDGMYIGDSAVGRNVEFMDKTASPGRLCRYHIEACFEGFPTDLASPSSKTVYTTTLLAEEQPYSVASYRESPVSPAWVEGDSATARLPLWFRADAAPPRQAVYMADRVWYIDNASDQNGPKGLLLDPDRPVQVVLSREDGTDESEEYFFWTPTDLTGRSSSETAIHLRKGDSLLFTAHGAGEALAIDAAGEGDFALQGRPGDVFPVRYDEPGIFTVTARIDGDAVGTLQVTVAEVVMSKETVYRHGLITSTAQDIAITSTLSFASHPEMGMYFPDGLQPSLTKRVNGSNTVAYSINLDTIAFLDTSMLYRFSHYRGPVVAGCAVKFVVASIEGRSYSPLLEQYEDGSALFGNCIQLHNPYDPVSVVVKITNSGPVFLDTGTSTRTVRADEFDENHQANVYIIATPAANGSAGYTVTFEMAVDEE